MTPTLRWTAAVLLLFFAATLLPSKTAGQDRHREALQHANSIKASRLSLLGRASELATSRLVEKSTYTWEENEWNPDTRTVHIYGEIGRAASWDYSWDGTDWFNTAVTRFTPFGNTFSESVRDIYDEGTREWSPSEKTVVDFLLEPVSGRPYANWMLYQTWNGTGWDNYERDLYTYDGELRLSAGQSEMWDDGWTPYYRFSIEQVEEDVYLTSQELTEGVWVNTERSVYRGWTIKELYQRLEELGQEIADYDDVFYGIQLLPDVLEQQWIGLEWKTIGRSVRSYDLFTGHVVDVVFEAWDEGNWIPEMRFHFTYSAPSIVESISNDFSDGETWMPYAVETYEYDDAGAISEVVQQIDLGEGLQNAGKVVFKWNHTGSDTGTDDIPGGFALDPAYPNPFNPAAHLTYRLAAAGPIAIRVYDALGRHVATLAQGMLPAGSHEVTFEGANLPSGQYIVRMEADGFTQSRVVTLLK